MGNSIYSTKKTNRLPSLAFMIDKTHNLYDIKKQRKWQICIIIPAIYMPDRYWRFSKSNMLKLRCFSIPQNLGGFPAPVFGGVKWEKIE